MAITDKQRETMLQGLIGLRRVRELLPSNPDVERGLEALKEGVGEAVSQRVAARTLGVSHPELSKLISARELEVVDTSRGRAQVTVASLVAHAEQHDVTPPEPPAWKRRRAEREAAGEDAEAEAQKQDLARIMQMRALAFHRALARNLDHEMVERAQQVVEEWRQSGQLTAEQADAWAAVLERPVTDIAARMTDYSPAGDELRASSPFELLGRRADDPH